MSSYLKDDDKKLYAQMQISFAVICCIIIGFLILPWPITQINLSLNPQKMAINFVVLGLFSIFYSEAMHQFPDWWNWPTDPPVDQKDAWANGCYFAMITHSTIGYGDISPRHYVTRSMVYLHAILVVLINFVGSK